MSCWSGEEVNKLSREEYIKVLELAYDNISTSGNNDDGFGICVAVQQAMKEYVSRFRDRIPEWDYSEMETNIELVGNDFKEWIVDEGLKFDKAFRWNRYWKCDDDTRRSILKKYIKKLKAKGEKKDWKHEWWVIWSGNGGTDILGGLRTKKEMETYVRSQSGLTILQYGKTGRRFKESKREIEFRNKD